MLCKIGVDQQCGSDYNKKDGLINCCWEKTNCVKSGKCALFPWDQIAHLTNGYYIYDNHNDGQYI